MKFVSIVGARPNFMKLAPLARAFAPHADVEHFIVHTGQHYDAAMSDDFFRDLEIPEPRYHLAVGSGSHAAQTAAVMERLEPVLLDERPDVVIVYGDVNSTAAAALTAAKLNIRTAHVEAGLRSRDRTMPEEINRMVTDAIADLLLAPSPDAVENLRAEGHTDAQIHFVGNIMIDTLVHALAKQQNGSPRTAGPMPTEPYLVATLHRPANVDHPATIAELMSALVELGAEMPVVFPGASAHPRAPPGARRNRPPGPERPPAADGSPQLPGHGPPRRRRPGGHHGLRRPPGRDELPRRSLPHRSHHDRTADHLHRRDQPAGSRRPPVRGGGHAGRPSDETRRATHHRTMGWPHGGADCVASVQRSNGKLGPNPNKIQALLEFVTLVTLDIVATTARLIHKYHASTPCQPVPGPVSFATTLKAHHNGGAAGGRKCSRDNACCRVATQQAALPPIATEQLHHDLILTLHLPARAVLGPGTRPSPR